MATLEQTYDLRTDTALRNRVAAACWNLAKDIILEDTGIANHAARMVWAQAAIVDDGSGQAINRVFMGVIVVHADDIGGLSDADITTTVGQVITKLAV